MRTRDDYYTPVELADKLVAYIPSNNFTTAADFCVGDGDLLKAVQKKFPFIKCYGTDIAEDAIKRLKLTHSLWNLAVCDSLDEIALQKVPFIGFQKFDLIVLNPPFTCKGSTVHKCEFDGTYFNISTAMLFVVKALQFKTGFGELFAILPSSCAYSQKDRQIWKYLEDYYNLQILEEPNRLYWKNCSANIVLVSIGGKSKTTTSKTTSQLGFKNLPILKIERGRINPVNATTQEGNDGVCFVHTTNLHNNEIVNSVRIKNPSRKGSNRYGEQVCKGPAVLLPRVCNPNVGKVCVFKESVPFIPSDCVIVMSVSSIEDAQLVANCIIQRWNDFRVIYQGTAAKYTTMSRIRELFGL